MKLKSRLSKMVSGCMAASLCVTMLPSIPAFAASGDKFVVGNGTNQYKSTSDGYSYEVWIDNTGGTGSMTLGSGATFKAEWSAAVPQGNFLARRGLDFGSQKKATDYDYIGLDYEATYKQTNSGGNSRLCVYGWFENKNAAGNPPLVEYYIIEDWVNWCPSANGGASKTVTIDGAEYEIFAIDHTGPTIHGGSETFKQYFSVRKNSRTSGHITVSDHFKAWADQGWGIGNLYEVSLNAEGWESSGVADVTMLDVYLDGDAPQPTTAPVPAESDGNFFKSTFESGADNWTGRGDATVKQDSKNYYAGNNSLLVSGRTDNWHGAQISLDSKTYLPGDSYSFSTAVLQKSGETTDMKLTLQYRLNGEDNYDEVASASAKSGEWTKLENTSFTIPKGASNVILYVEAPDSLTDFYIDNAQVVKSGTKSDVVTGGGTVEGSSSTPSTNPTNPTTTPTNPSTPSGNIIYGDANNDGKVNMADATFIIQYVGNKDKYKLVGDAVTAADCYRPGSGVDGLDALAVQKHVAGILDTLPDGDPVSNPSTSTQTPPASTTAGGNNNNNSSVTPTAYMENVRKNMTSNVPASATAASNAGKIEDITYFSSTANRNKSAKVLLPEGYSKNEKYPVLYVNHGIFGDETSMIGMGVDNLAKNLMASGEAEKMIVVFTNMFSSNTMAAPGGMDQSTFDGYDMFLDDLTKDLMPYIEKNYSIKTGRENTAISGFSMGGRESLYIGVSRPDLFGYIGAACPAPGVTPGVDSFATHPGNMSESEFKIKDTKNYPYLWLITGGTNDTVVGTFPQKYHEILTTNGQDHIWQEIQGGGHDGSCVIPMMYNFMKGIFKTGGSSSSSSQPTSTTPANTSDANIYNNFDSSTGDWTGRGDASVKLDSDNYYSGKSLAVSGRTDNWNGAAINLDTATFVPGNAYSFSAAVLQRSGSSDTIKLTLQYELNGEANYDEVASVSAKSGEWTKLENTSYKIPSGAKNLVLYFEADTLTDFYVDEVKLAKEGTKSDVVTGKGTVSAAAVTTIKVPENGVDISWIDPTKPMVAISFDDGAVGNAPTDTSMRIINALSDSGFHSTFFYVGDWINSSGKEEEVKYAFSKGMEIANHTTSHPDLSTKSASEIRSEYDKCESKLKNIIGTAPSKLLRLPYLASNNTVTSTLSDVPMITCAIDTGDWNNASANDIISKVVNAKNNGSLNGSIVLAHETYSSTAEAMEYLAPYLKSEGWQIVTISEMFAVKGKSLNGGQIYTKAN